MRGAGDRIRDEVLRWPGVSHAPHRFGGVEFRLGRRELGHLHGDRLVDLPFPRHIRDELVASGRAQPHHVLPDSGWVSFRLRGSADVDDAIALFRLNYDRPWRTDRRDDAVDEASEESFPASDPPASGPIVGIGHASRSE